MLPTVEFVSTFIERQFPSFYREDGDKFIQFVKAYYEWMEQSGQTSQKTRNLFSTRDIDLTADQFVEEFKKKYLFGIPTEIAGDKRFLQKHILDIYRSKGSIEGLQLLFRLLYNEEIDVYIPSVDILKPSDGTWVEKKYLEVSHTDFNDEFNGKFITGATSGATAFVESFERLYTDSRIIDIFYISNMTGMFVVDEKIIYSGLNAFNAPRILGSPDSITINGTVPDNQVGDILLPVSGSGSGVNLKTIISTTRNAGSSNATIEFKIINGGYGYTSTPTISITTGGNTTGTGATFTGVTLSNTSTFTYNNNFISAVSSTLLNAVNYGPTLNNASLSSVIDTALTNFTKTIGTIDKLTGINPGNGYDGYINISISEPAIAGYGLPSPSGGIQGADAVVHGNVVIGTGLVDTVKIKNSGFGYHTKLEPIEIYNDTQSNTSQISLGTINLGGVGQKEGYWSTTRGFLDSNKYIQDSYYYQEYSYQILSSKSLDKYLKVLKDVFHPVGNEVFGRALILMEDDTPINIENTPTVYRILGSQLAPAVDPEVDVFALNISRLN